jgi:transcriptional regulator with XRE-family HTH domain
MTPITLRLRELREAQKLTQTQLAERSGVNQGTISKIEGGQTGGIDFETLEKLADALGVNAALLIHHDPTTRGGAMQAVTGKARALGSPCPTCGARIVETKSVRALDAMTFEGRIHGARIATQYRCERGHRWKEPFPPPAEDSSGS